MPATSAKPDPDGNANASGLFDRSKTLFADKGLIAALTCSKIYQDYKRAFTEATGLTVILHGVESWQLPYRENPFCAIMARRSASRAACLRIQEQLWRSARHEPQTLTCFSGMRETAVPVRSGETLIGFLQTGQIFCKKPSGAQFRRVSKQLRSWGVDVNGAQLRGSA